MSVENIEISKMLASASRDMSEGTSEISSGFAVPRHMEGYLSVDLNHELVAHPESTFYVRVQGSAMQDAGVEPGDILLVDKSLDVVDGDMAVCVLNGEFLVRYFCVRNGQVVLRSAHPDVASISVGEVDDFSVWGVVTYTIRKMRNRRTAKAEK